MGWEKKPGYPPTALRFPSKCSIESIKLPYHTPLPYSSDPTAFSYPMSKHQQEGLRVLPLKKWPSYGLEMRVQTHTGQGGHTYGFPFLRGMLKPLTYARYWHHDEFQAEFNAWNDSAMGFSASCSGGLSRVQLPSRKDFHYTGSWVGVGCCAEVSFPQDCTCAHRKPVQTVRKI